jgi:CheY-like chemotaxis protein
MKEILLIEDNEGDALLLERSLRASSVANPIRHVSNGADALLFLNAKEQQLLQGDQGELGIIFFDLKLPDKTGFELLSLVQERKSFSNVLKIVVSQMGDMENIRRAYTLGADSFITKPASKLDVRELIRAFPDNWFLTDSASAEDTATEERKQDGAAEPHDQAAQVWCRNRKLIDALRSNLDNLRVQLSDNEETFVIIETLTEELRQRVTAGSQPSPTSKRLGSDSFS